MKKLAADGQYQFGDIAAARGNARKVKFAPVMAPPPPTAQDLEGYFDNLAAAATNEKTVLDQLVATNTKLAATNAELAEAVKQLTADMHLLRQEVSGLKQLVGGGRSREGG